MSKPPQKPRTPDSMYGVTLKAMAERLVDRCGWDGFGERITMELLGRSAWHERT